VRTARGVAVDRPRVDPPFPIYEGAPCEEHRREIDELRRLVLSLQADMVELLRRVAALEPKR
jgi:hypothetical protein